GPLRKCWTWFLLPGSPARVMLRVQLLQPLARNVSVDLRGGDIGVAKQHLDHAEVGAMIEQVSGEGMAQSVRRERRRRDARENGVALDHVPEGLAGERRPARGQEDRLRESCACAGCRARERGTGFLEVAVYPRHGLLADGNEAFLVALAYHSHDA